MNRSSNLNMYLPENSDYRDVSQLSANFSTLDGSVGALADGLAIVSVGNTHAAIASGQYVYIMNHSSLSEGLYRATSAISANTTLSGSNVTAVSGGGLNELSGSIALLAGSTKWADWTEITSYTNGEAWNGSYYTKIGKITYLQISVKGLTANTNTVLFTLPSGYRPLFVIDFDGFGGLQYLNHAHLKVSDNGNVSVYSSDTYATGFIAFPSL